jgi:hypothetical protein
LASRTCTPHAGAHPDFFHTLKLVVLDLKSKPATENEAEPVSCKFANFVQSQAIEEFEKPSHDFVQRDNGLRPRHAR